ncbi:hypothetical protein FOB24_07685 [Citrobacter werkmanii]|nr:hypothetical protein FOB24_07685 [Citrobacter werkmanii]
MLRLFSQFPANFCLNTVRLPQNSDKTKRPAGRFHIFCSNILEKHRLLQIRFLRDAPGSTTRGRRKDRVLQRFPLLNGIGMQG